MPKQSETKSLFSSLGRGGEGDLIFHVGSRDIADLFLEFTAEKLYKFVLKKFCSIKLLKVTDNMTTGLLCETLIKRHCLQHFSSLNGNVTYRSKMFKSTLAGLSNILFMAQSDVFYLSGKMRNIIEIKCKSSPLGYNGEIKPEFVMSVIDYFQMCIQHILGKSDMFYYVRVDGAFVTTGSQIMLDLYKVQIDETICESLTVFMIDFDKKLALFIDRWEKRINVEYFFKEDRSAEDILRGALSSSDFSFLNTLFGYKMESERGLSWDRFHVMLSHLETVSFDRKEFFSMI